MASVAIETCTGNAAVADQDSRRRVLIIVNPAAGRSWSSRRRLARVIAALERRGCMAELRRAGAAIGDAERLARDAVPEFDVIVAAGGDGTLNAVVNGVAGTQRAIALLPFGTANVFAREIGLPRRPERLAQLIAAGPERPIWPGRVGRRLFLQMVSAGFDAETVAAVNPHLKDYVGRFAFVWAILLSLARYRSSELRVEVNGTEHRAAAVIAAKGRHYAGGFVIAGGANIAEPMLDLVLFRRSGRQAVLRYLAAMLLGRVAQLDDVAIMRARSVSVSADKPVPVQADGEIVGALPVSIEIAEHPVLFVGP